MVLYEDMPMGVLGLLYVTRKDTPPDTLDLVAINISWLTLGTKLVRRYVSIELCIGMHTDVCIDVLRLLAFKCALDRLREN